MSDDYFDNDSFDSEYWDDDYYEKNSGMYSRSSGPKLGTILLVLMILWLIGKAC